MKIYNNLTEIIGHTPLVRLNKIEKNNNTCAKIVAKLEYMNPTGSIKDRTILEIINDAIDAKELYDGVTIIEPSVGDAGVGLAAIGASYGFRVIVTMPDNVSQDRINLVKAYGAEVILTDSVFGIEGAIDKAKELKRILPRAIIASQFINMANPTAHYKTTGPEIWEDTDGLVDILVCGIGTGGTISGAGAYLKEKNPDIKVIGVEPINSNILNGGEKGSHKIDGMGNGFIASVLDTFIYDEIIDVSDEDSYRMCEELAKLEGYLTGPSSGATLLAAIEVAKRSENKDKIVCCVLPDIGTRYINKDLYR